jgi:polar amino acid transport system permease protein
MSESTAVPAKAKTTAGEPENGIRQPYHLVAARHPWSVGHERTLNLVLAGGVAAVAVVVLWLLIRSGGASPASSYAWDFGVVGRYVPVLWAGLKITAAIAVVSTVAGMLLGIPVALAQLSRLAAVRWGVTVYVEIMRCIPMLVLLVWIYYALPIITGIALPAFQAVVLAFTLNSAAFYGEAFRSGIKSLPRGQVEAATILGLSYVQRMRYVIVPQGLRNVLPVLVSISVQLFKDSSLVAIIGVADLMYNGQLASSNSYRPLEILTTVAVIYFAILFPITLALRQLEKRMSRHRQ